MLAKVYTVRDLSEYFGKTEGTIRRWIDEGKFPHARKVGGGYYITKEDVETLLGITPTQ